MLADLFYWTGALLWACIAVALAWLAIEVVVGLCCAVSLYRWMKSIYAEHEIAGQRGGSVEWPVLILARDWG